MGANEAYTRHLYESALIEYAAAETAQSLCDLGSDRDRSPSLLLRYEDVTATEFAQENKEPPDVRDALRAADLPGWSFEP